MVSKKSITHKKNPLVSVLMPAYNAEKYIGQAIESILAQTFIDFELVIIDDASTDSTWELIRKYQKLDKRIIALKNKENLKLSHTLNLGIEKSIGRYIARMDADDWSYPDRLEKQYKFLEKNKNVGILGGTMEIMKENGRYLGKRSYPKNDKSIRNNIFWFSPFSHPLIMIRRSVLEKIELYNPIFNPAEDYELYFRIGAISKFANLDDTLLKYRVIEKSMTTGSTKKMELQTIKIRNMYANTKGYNMSTLQKMYNSFHYLSLYIIPSKLKMYIFHTIRNTK